MTYNNLDFDNKYRLWNCVLYPEDETHNDAIAYILQEFNAVGVLHNEDIYHSEDDDELPEEGSSYNEGDKLKPHYHFILKFPNARYRSSIAKELNISKYYFVPTKSWYGSAKYLLHIGHPDKWQYDIEDLVGSLASSVRALVDDIPVEEKYIKIIDWIDANKRYIPSITLQRYCISQGFFSVLRGTYKILTDYLNSHNSHYQDKILKGGE